MVTKNLSKGRGWLIFWKFSLGRSLRKICSEENKPHTARACLSEIVEPELLMQLYRMPLFSVVKKMHFVWPFELLVDILNYIKNVVCCKFFRQAPYRSTNTQRLEDKVYTQYCFPSMSKCLRKFVDNCTTWKLSKSASGKAQEELHPIPKVSIPWHTVYFGDFTRRA